ncbi:expressed unknown protein [Seminavis robusta]|uniref:Transmembrane protein n=1 Tax=Seminavis robusta TaxID=568900 RepID=A0A9N8DQI9_9STRA|nr:expressed unknown protein [Seminavis robusta]|eukprot:Sro275_g105770.1 n/a (202) ;mRNA; f:53180-53785
MTNPIHALAATGPQLTRNKEPKSEEQPPAPIEAPEGEAVEEPKKDSVAQDHGFGSGLLAIGIYALMHDSGIMTILLLAFVWQFSLDASHQRIFLFFLVLLNFAEYFYLLPEVLARYQREKWWDIPTIKTATLTTVIFWSIAWVSAWYTSYLENKEQERRLEKAQMRAKKEQWFQQQSAMASSPGSSDTLCEGTEDGTSEDS